jgi:hypothetical protein
VLDEPFIGIDREVPGSFVDYVHLNQVRQGSRACTVDAGCVDVTNVLAAVSAGRGMATAVESFRGFENWPGVCYVPITGIEPETNVLISRRGIRHRWSPPSWPPPNTRSRPRAVLWRRCLQRKRPVTGGKRPLGQAGFGNSTCGSLGLTEAPRASSRTASSRGRRAMTLRDARLKRDRHDSGQSPVGPDLDGDRQLPGRAV